MGCRPQGTTLEEVNNLRKLGKYAMVPLENQTQEETIARCEFLRREVSKVDEEYRMFGGVFKVAKRVSEIAKRSFGLSKKSLTEDDDIKRKMGTKLHAVLADLMEYYANGVGTLSDVRNKALQGDYKITLEQFSQLASLVNTTHKNIIKLQEKIDPTKKGKAKIYTEQFNIDWKENLGGTMDIFVIFSDNTGAIYDYKTTGKESAIGRGKKGYEVQEMLLPYYQTQSYDLSMAEYKRIAIERLGIKRIRENRLLPIALQYKRKSKEDSEVGSTLKPELKILIADQNLSEYLQPIPAGGESSRWTGINKLLEKQYTLINKFQKSLENKGLDYAERTKLIDRIKSIENTIRRTLVNEDITPIINNIIDVSSMVDRRLNEPETLENGQVNPSYPTLDELRDFRSEMEVYSNIISETNIYFQDIKKQNEDDYNKLRKNLDNIIPIHQRISAKLQSAIENGIREPVGEEHYDENGYIKSTKELNFADLQTKKISEIDHPIFHGAWKVIRDAQFDIKDSFKSMDTEVWEKTENLWKWASDNHMSRQDAFDLLINKKDGNLYKKLDKKFYIQRENALIQKDDEALKFMKSSYEIKDIEKFKKEYKVKLEAEQARQKAKFNNFEPTIDVDNNVIATSEKQKRDYEDAINSFVKFNNLLESDSAWFNTSNLRYLKIKNSVMEQNYSTDYKRIMASKPLLEYYEMYQKYIKEFSEMLGISSFDHIPENFIPNIRKEMMEHLSFDSFSLRSTFKEFLDSFKVREEDVYRTNVDENGEFNQVPVLFVNKFFDEDGKLDLNMKSYELSSSLMIFGRMAYNYKYMTKIEPVIGAMKITLGDPSPESGGLEATDKLGHRIKGRIQGYLTKEGRLSETYRLFQDITDNYLYGVKFKEQTMTPGVDLVHILTKGKNFNSSLKLGFAFVPAFGALVAGHLGDYIVGKKGISYTSEQLNDAKKDIIFHRAETNALSAFFDPYNDDYADREFQKYKTTMKNKSLDRLLFSFLRRADISITKPVIGAMSRNYGIDKNGGIVRLNKPGVDATQYKTIKESASLDKDGNFTIEGLSKEGFIQFVAAVKSTMTSVIGNMNPDDIGRSDVGFIQNQLFAFRSWMPGVVRERIGKLQYDDAIDALKWGRFNAYFSEYGYKLSTQEIEDAKKFHTYIKHILLPNMAKLVADLTTFGLVPSLVKNRVNKEMAERRYHQWLEENKHLRGKVTFDDFLQIKEGQIKAMLVELRIIMGFLGLAMFLGGAGDDGEKRYMDNFLTRNLFKVINKAGSELTFMWNPTEFIKLMKNPFPITGLVDLAFNTFRNTIQETDHILSGDHPRGDSTPIGYYSLQWIKGGPQIMRFFEVYKNFERSPYAVFSLAPR